MPPAAMSALQQRGMATSAILVSRPLRIPTVMCWLTIGPRLRSIHLRSTRAVIPVETNTSGRRLAKPPTPPPPPLRLSAYDSKITIRVFVDEDFVEVYFQEGRQVITWGRDSKEKLDGRGSISAFASGAVIRVLGAVAFQMDSIWVDAVELMSLK